MKPWLKLKAGSGYDGGRWFAPGATNEIVMGYEVAEYEQLRMIVVTREPWSIENGFLTPTMKVRRARIEKAKEPHVERWYGTRQRVHWH